MNTLEFNRTVAEDQQLMDLVEEITARLQAGESCDIEEYAAWYPEYAARLRDWISVMQAMADLGHSLLAVNDGRQKFIGASVKATAEVPVEGHATNQMTGVLGDFRILREVGRGGMGVVYEAEQISLSRRVALKVLPFAAMLDRQQLARFKNEARAAATLDHRNIVAIYSVGVERSVHFYAMQLIEGQSLAEVIACMKTGRPSSYAETAPAVAIGENLPADDTAKAALPTACTGSAAFSSIPPFASPDYFRAIAQLGIQAAEALDHAHQNGILHRDIKPANLLLECQTPSPLRGGLGRGSGDGSHLKLWITDFGLARMEQDAGMTMTGDLLGTLRYMSPEQALAKRVVVDHRSDIYSLGVTLYELLTLQSAYSATDRQELLRQIAFEEPRPPRQINYCIPQDLETIVVNAIEKNPSDRFSTAGQLADELRRFLNHEPITSRRPTWHQHLAKWSRRHPVSVRVAMISTLVAAIVVAASCGWVLRDRSARQAALDQLVLQALQDSDIWYKTGNVEEALSAAKRAQGLAISGATEMVAARVARWLADMVAIREFERLQFATPSDKMQGYAKVFGSYGILLNVVSLEKAADLINQASIKEALVAALNEWFQAGYGDISDEDSLRVISDTQKAIFELADQVDPDPWRLRLRAAILRGDRLQLEGLANDKSVLTQSPATIRLLGRALFRESPTGSAAELLQRAQQRYPNDFWINIHLATCLSGNADRREDVIAYRRVAVALRPSSGLAHDHLASVLAGAGKHAEAEPEFREAIRLLAPENSYISQCGLAICLDEMGRRAEADAVLNDLGSPRRFRDYSAQTQVMEHFGRFASAEAAARKAVRLFPELPQSHMLLRAVLHTRQKHREAAAEMREAIRLSPAGSLWWVWLKAGHTYYRAGDWKACVDALETSIELQDTGGESSQWFLLAMAHWQLGHKTEALDWYYRAIEWMETNQPNHEWLQSLRREAEALIGPEIDSKSPLLPNESKSIQSQKSSPLNADP